MIKEARGFGHTIDEARENAILNLNASENDDIQFEVITTPKKKTLGLFGGCMAEVRVYVELPDEKPKKAKKNNTKKETVKVEKTVKTSESEKKTSDDKEFGPLVFENEIPADSRAGKAIAYLKPILENLGCTNIVIKVAQRENAALIDLEGDGLGTIIGHRGETLDSLQYLAGLAANNGGGYYKVALNIGNYREKREETLTNLAKRISNQVLNTGKTRSLEPMNPYERRIIHTAVQNIDGVISASFGEGSNRRVVIGIEGQELRAPRNNRRDGGRRNDRSRASRSTQRIVTAPDREPKKDTDIPLYGKIN